MKLITIIVLYLQLIFTVTGVYASGSFDPFFEIPSYIDTEYKVPDYAEIGYGRNTKVGLIRRMYQHAELPQEKPNDAIARYASGLREIYKYAKYSEGARKFNAGAFEEALKIFTELTLSSLFNKSNYSWAKEASTYMIARCQLRIAQRNWDGYDNPTEVVDQNMLQAADASYQLYLKEYPQGLYANSARNIRRKILYLSGNREELNKDLKRAMLEAYPISPDSIALHSINSKIVDEFENYFDGEIDIAHDSPILVAYAFLGENPLKADDVALLEAREKDFSAYFGLFRYLRALGLYRLEQYQEMLNKTPEQPLTKDVLSLSTQLLRSRALLQLGKANEALIALEKMHKISPEDAVELEIVYLKLNSGDGLWLYKNQSPLKMEKILRSVAQFALTDVELEKGVSSKEIVNEKRKFLVDELARRYLLSKRFKKLSALLTKEEGTGIFVSLKSVSVVLAENANNEQALVDVGEFIYQNYITYTTMLPLGKNEWDNQWNWSNSYSGILPGKIISRCKPCKEYQECSKNYAPPISFFGFVTDKARQSGEKSEAEAKALHYIAKCMRSGGEFRDRCTWGNDGGRTATYSSKSAFMRLHKLYKNSPWAAKTPYYYD